MDESKPLAPPPPRRPSQGEPLGKPKPRADETYRWLAMFAEECRRAPTNDRGTVEVHRSIVDEVERALREITALRSEVEYCNARLKSLRSRP